MDEIRRLADAVLYEGHVLWPYRRSAAKNQQRWTFGGVYPRVYAEASADRSTVGFECLLEGDAPSVEVEVRFLHVMHRQAARGAALEPVDEIAGCLTWDEARERNVRLRRLEVGARERSAVVALPAGRAVEPVDGGALVRTWERLDGHVGAALEALAPALQRVRVTITNASDWSGTSRDEAVRRSLLSAHAIVRARHGALVSAIDPPEALCDATDALRRDGLWPVLVGEDGARDTMLAAPIILADYARVAPESPGDFFDGGEIDQLLVLNILALTDEEKREIAAGDPRAREILERTEAMTPAEMGRLNGTIRDFARLPRT